MHNALKMHRPEEIHIVHISVEALKWVYRSKINTFLELVLLSISEHCSAYEESCIMFRSFGGA